MSAVFQLRKYIGNDGSMGMYVSKIGLKRIDSVVPAVYGMPIVPGDDASDVNTYAIRRSDTNETVYSFESIFKMVLTVPPSNQLSNVRIYPSTSVPLDPNIPKLFVGCSKSYSRPTNTKSLTALANIWDYSATSPFCVTVGNNFGQTVNDQLPVQSYSMRVHDLGYGNIIYLNNERQLPIPVVAGNGTYTIVNTSTSQMTISIYNPADLTVVSHADITTAIVSGNQVVYINATTALKTAYPNGLLYGSSVSSTVGGIVYWVDFSASVVDTVVYDVTLETLPNGSKVYAFNGVRNPIINFRENMIYQFMNHVGDTDPIRFVNDSTLPMANVESKMVIDGVYVENGGTINEIVTVKPAETTVAGKVIRAYQSVLNGCYGNTVTNTNTALVGNYNINTVGAGVYNPMSAGETDYIYLQLEVAPDASVGQMMPDIIIEYDES